RDFIVVSRNAHQGFIGVRDAWRMKHIACLFALLAVDGAETPPEMPPSPDLVRAYVTIPYSELRALWEAGQRKPEPPAPPEVAPVSFLVHRAEVRIALGDAASKIEADFEVEALDK